MPDVERPQSLNWYVADQLKNVKVGKGIGALLEGVRSAKVEHLKATQQSATDAEEKYRQTANRIKKGSLIKMAVESVDLLPKDRATAILDAIKNTYDLRDLPHSTRVALKVAERHIAGNKVSKLEIHVREGIQAIKESLSDLWKVATGKALETLPEYRKIMKLAGQNDFGPEFSESLKKFISKTQNTAGQESPIVTVLKDFDKVVASKDSATMGRFASLIRSKIDPKLKAQVMKSLSDVQNAAAFLSLVDELSSEMQKVSEEAAAIDHGLKAGVGFSSFINIYSREAGKAVQRLQELVDKATNEAKAAVQEEKKVLEKDKKAATERSKQKKAEAEAAAAFSTMAVQFLGENVQYLAQIVKQRSGSLEKFTIGLKDIMFATRKGSDMIALLRALRGVVETGDESAMQAFAQFIEDKNLALGLARKLEIIKEIPSVIDAAKKNTIGTDDEKIKRAVAEAIVSKMRIEIHQAKALWKSYGQKVQLALGEKCEAAKAFGVINERFISRGIEHTGRVTEASRARDEYDQASRELAKAKTQLSKTEFEAKKRDRDLLMAKAMGETKKERKAAEDYKHEADTRAALASTVVEKVEKAVTLTRVDDKGLDALEEELREATKNKQQASEDAHKAADLLRCAEKNVVSLIAAPVKELILTYVDEKKCSKDVEEALLSLIDTAVKNGKENLTINLVKQAVKTLIEKGGDIKDFSLLIGSDLDLENKLEVLQLVNDAPNECMAYFKQMAGAAAGIEREATLADIVYKVANIMAERARDEVRAQEAIVKAGNEAVAKQKEEVSRVRAIAEREKQSERLATSFEEGFGMMVPGEVASARGRSQKSEETFLSAQEKLTWLEKHAKQAAGELEKNRLAVKRAEEKLRKAEKAQIAVQEFRKRSDLESASAKLSETDAKQAFQEIINADILSDQDKAGVVNQVMRCEAPDLYIYEVRGLLLVAKFAQSQAEKARTEFKMMSEKAEAQRAAVGRSGYNEKQTAGLDVEGREREAKEALEKLKSAIRKRDLTIRAKTS